MLIILFFKKTIEGANKSILTEIKSVVEDSVGEERKGNYERTSDIWGVMYMLVNLIVVIVSQVAKYVTTHQITQFKYVYSWLYIS